MSDWQPIETAPKDGTPILLRAENFSPSELFYWHKARKSWCTKVVLGVATFEWDKSDGGPTHWRYAPGDRYTRH